ncbi:MAG: T9SS type A sorting domain-containing protein, partial [Bacteroidia bacterium]|nr:T9SS type A sorting domain-containing protein [Bacteroidia bacterium]
QNIQLMKQVIYDGDSVGFEKVYEKIDVLSSNVRPIYNTPSDIPAIVDVDNDGDLDIISSQTGTNFFALHTNMAVEKYGRCDTMDYVVGTGCWGHFYESNLDNTLVLGDTVYCKRGDEDPTGLGLRHVGSTLLVNDFDGNGLKDVMLGDVSYATVNVAFNHGTIDHAFMDSAVYEYPSTDIPVYQILFPGLFMVDVDNDGIRDLITSPNAQAGGEDVDGTLLYLNKGTNDFPDFKFQGRGFLSGGSIDAGRTSMPTFLDYNDDGLTDILIGANSATLRSADTTILAFQLQLYENVGTPAAPAFQLVDADYLKASTLFPPLEAAAPVAVDIDNDGDDDLMMGSANGTLRIFENAAPAGQKAVYVQLAPQLKDNLNQTIDVGNASAPELYDFDGDGDFDLFVGSAFGHITYYENTGTMQSPVFTFVSDSFGQIVVTNQYGAKFSGTARPRFIDYDNDNVTELLVGAEDGYVHVFETPQAGLTTSIIPTSTLFGEDFGNRTSIAAAPLDESGDLFYIFGSDRGGLQMWNSRVDTTVTASVFSPKSLPKVKIFPNPARESVRIEWPGNGRDLAQVRVLNGLGQEVATHQLRAPQADISLQELPLGLYFVLIEEAGGRWLGRVVKE